MENTIRLYRTLFGNRAYVRSVCTGAVFLAASTIAIFAAVTYATVHASNHVTDFVLSRVGPFNVRFLFVYGTFIAFAITASLLAWRPTIRKQFEKWVEARTRGRPTLVPTGEPGRTPEPFVLHAVGSEDSSSSRQSKTGS